MEKIETNIFDKVEHVYNCAVEILTNSITGEQTIAWAPMESKIAEDWMDEDLIQIDKWNEESREYFNSLVEEQQKALDKLFGLDENK